MEDALIPLALAKAATNAIEAHFKHRRFSLEVPIKGVPGLRTLAVEISRVSHETATVSARGEGRSYSVTLGIPPKCLKNEARRLARLAALPERTSHEGVEWRKILFPETLLEKTLYQGIVVTHPVSTSTYPYLMHCECGNTRLAKPNCISQITKCRVCQELSRLEKKRKR